MINSEGFPVTQRSVDTAPLHPRFKERLHAFFADPRIHGKVSIVSAARSQAHQARLYRNWREGKPGANLAANPERRLPGGWKGSWHMTQDSGHAYAVDFRNLGVITNSQINDIATEYGIVPTIRSKEWWHHQPRNQNGWFDAPAMGEEVKKKGLNLQVLAYLLAVQTEEVNKTPLRRRSRGRAVKTLQSRLGDLGLDAGPVDGIFGSRTKSAVKAFQRRRGLLVDGVVGKNTWAELWKPIDVDELKD